MPLTGRNIASVQPLGTPPRAPAATPRDRSEKQQNLPELLVERPSGPETVSGVSGRVTDQSGAVIAGATVALRDASGGTRQIATEADGSFRLTGIPSGHYDLTVTSPGFKSNQQSIDLKPSELAMVQPVLAVGEVTQTVEVAASAPMLETDSARVVSFPAKLPSRLQVASSASIGKRMLSLDGAGTLFLSRNTGKSWKKVHPQWTGKAVRVDVTAAQPDEAKNKIEASGAESAQSVFRLTTDSGSQWTSKDGTHWHPQ
ncbi:MAG TPA: carboxypeptidase-like regulatory domain-containing protein [Candidatus Acidoferrales bacterium]|nr:carboxypeptidase-like regulatory domain-containing protein [Candidatus Acidoferrales bacterium]